MDNLSWYTRLLRFCNLSDCCARCPYHLDTDSAINGALPCFSDKQSLEALSIWLVSPCAYHPDDNEITEMMDDIANKDDEQYLLDEMDRV